MGLDWDGRSWSSKAGRGGALVPTNEGVSVLESACGRTGRAPQAVCARRSSVAPLMDGPGCSGELPESVRGRTDATAPLKPQRRSQRGVPGQSGASSLRRSPGNQPALSPVRSAVPPRAERHIWLLGSFKASRAHVAPTATKHQFIKDGGGGGALAACCSFSEVCFSV